tara:strand:+ start:4528 stop:7935 length:3408 start_codon:yes stop_codon:yes gene_type:complete
MKTQILFKADIDTKGFKAKIDGLKGGIEELVVKQTKLDTSTKEGAAAFVKNDVAIRKLTSESKRYERVLKDLSLGSVNAAANNKTLNASLNEEVRSINQARASNKKLLAIRNDLNLSTKEGTSAQKKINAQIEKNNKFIKTNVGALEKQKINIGNYGTAVGKATGMLKRFVSAFAIFGLIKNSFKIVKEFEQSQANLASVLGVNTDEMAGLTEQAKELGATTTFTASQVAELALSFAKLGFSQPEIEGMTEATLALAEATGTELGEAASVVGATMRGFGLDVSETQRVTDVMAKSFSSSSLDMAKFSTAMASVAPVANLAGVGLEKTTALLGTLTDRGLDASTAGTGLRNMFLRSNAAGLTFDEALAQIGNSTDQTAESMKLFGTRGATLGVILANTKGDVDTLTDSVTNSEGAAQAMADTQRDTLGGSIKLLQSAWEGLILKFEEGTGVFGTVKNVIKTLAENLGGVVTALGVAGGAWLTYKAVTLASTAVDGVKATITAVRTLGATIKAMTIFQRLATAAQWLWNVALNANPIGLIVIAVTGLIAAGYGLLRLFGFLSSDTEANSRANEANAVAIERSTKASKDKARALKELSNELARANTEELSLARANGASTEELRKLERAQHAANISLAESTLKTIQSTVAQKELNLARHEENLLLAEKHGLSDKAEDQTRKIALAKEELKGARLNESVATRIKDDAHKARIASSKKYDLEDAAIRTTAENKRIKDAETTAKNIEAEGKRLQKEKESRLRQAAELTKQLGEELLATEEELSEMIYQASLGAQEKELTAVRDKYFEKIEQAKQYNLDVTALEAEQKAKEDEIKKSYSDKELADKEILREALSTDLENELESVQTRYDSLNELAEGDKEKQKELAILLEDELAEIRSEAAKKELADIQEADRKKVDMAIRAVGAIGELISSSYGDSEAEQKKAFKVTKAFNTATALANTGLAVTGALTAGGNPIKLATGAQFVEAAIVGAMGLAQVANIQKTKFKAERGISFEGTLQGASHANGGINLGNGVEAEGGENMYVSGGKTHIVNKKASSLINRLGIMGALSMINQREGNGVALNVPTSYASRGGLVSTGNSVEIDYSKMANAFEMGASRVNNTVSVTDINSVGGRMVSVSDFSTI